MSQTFRLIFLFSAVLCLVFAGCSSSETTQRDSSPDASVAPGDSSAIETSQAAQLKKSRLQRLSGTGKQQGFVTQEDTIEAQVVTRKKGTAHPKAPPKRSAKKKFYSVQIGAFRELSNADHAHKLVKQRYKKQIYHFYDKAIKMYRVTVGNFSKLPDALKFLKTVQQAHPKEYKDAWVAEMRR